MSSASIVNERPGVALIGGGFIGPVHVEAPCRIGIQVVGLLDISPERARPQAERLAIGRVYADLDEPLGDPPIGVVHVASPNTAHFEQARRVLESGRHVLCEEPLATTSAESSALKALAEAGYEGHVAIEVEDRAFEGSLQERLDSLVLSRRYLLQYMIG